MRRKDWLFLLSLLACASSWTAEAATAPQPSLPAGWRPYSLTVVLHDLPQPYSCEDLQYKFRDVLLALGARPDLNILVSRCEQRADYDTSRSPRVQLKFSLPELVTSPKSPAASAATKVRLGPGHPASLSSADCELLRQMKDGLLAPLSQKIVSFNLACAAPNDRWPFNVVVQTQLPSLASPAVVAQADALPNQR